MKKTILKCKVKNSKQRKNTKFDFKKTSSLIGWLYCEENEILFYDECTFSMNDFNIGFGLEKMIPEFCTEEIRIFALNWMWLFREEESNLSNSALFLIEKKTFTLSSPQQWLFCHEKIGTRDTFILFWTTARRIDGTSFFVQPKTHLSHWCLLLPERLKRTWLRTFSSSSKLSLRTERTLIWSIGLNTLYCKCWSVFFKRFKQPER